jgi:hypothetical protein
MSTIFKNGNAELKKLIQFPCLENLVAYFDSRTTEWCEPFISMECFTVGVFYDLAQSFKGSAAFELLNFASSMPTEHMPDRKYMRFIDLLSDLAKITDTSEMPPQLQQIWDGMVERADSIDPNSIGVVSLKRQYGIAE